MAKRKYRNQKTKSQAEISLKDSKINSLAIIYTFCPYVDTSGNVFAKRIQSEIKENITVITNKFVSNPPIDESLHELVKPYVQKTIEIQSTFTYRDWNHFQDFVKQAYDAYLKEIENGTKFSKLYSRSMSVISHIVAYKIKKHNPDIKWIAEFSDPIIKEVDGRERVVDIPLEWLKSERMIEFLRSFDNNQNLFFVSEILVYLFADEIVFTNGQQKEYMLGYLNEKYFDYKNSLTLLNNINSKSIVKVHPTLAPSFYSDRGIKLNINEKYINIGYFGNFNPNRGLSEFIDSWTSLDDYNRKRIRLFIFSNMNSDKIYGSIPKELKEFVSVNKALGYLDFLSVLDNFDFVLSLDTQVKDVLGINPFLPSKISDYLGAKKAKILALLERGSPTDLLIDPKIVKQYFGEIDLNQIIYLNTER